MTEDEKRIFGVANTPATFLEEDWRETPRPEMLERLIVAVDGAKSEAEEVGDENYVRYVDGALFPFLEAELEKAREPGHERRGAAPVRRSGRSRGMGPRPRDPGALGANDRGDRLGRADASHEEGAGRSREGDGPHA